MTKPTPKPQDKEWDDPYPKKRKSPWSWLAGIALVIGFYILSIGPASLLLKKGFIPESILRSVYSPLRMLVQKCPPLEPPLKWYIKLWN